MQDTILAIAGKPGLYKLLSQGRGALIVETLDAEKKRTTAGARDRVTALNDVSMYTDGEDVELMTVFQTLYNAKGGQLVELDVKKATAEELAEVMETALPNYDRDRVYNNDIRKLVQWYNLLVKAGYTEFEDKETEE